MVCLPGAGSSALRKASGKEPSKGRGRFEMHREKKVPAGLLKKASGKSARLTNGPNSYANRLGRPLQAD